MSNEKMLEEFEAWASHYVGYSWLKPDNGGSGDYFDDNIKSMWDAWKASRAALCVELPLAFSDERATTYLTGVTNALDAAGVRYK